jgi:hypothetical protein
VQRTAVPPSPEIFFARRHRTEEGKAADGALFNLALDRVGETQVMARGEMSVKCGSVLVDFVEDEAPWLLWIEEDVETLATRFALKVIRSRNCAMKEGFTRNSTSTTRGRMIPPPSVLCHPSAHLESEAT